VSAGSERLKAKAVDPPKQQKESVSDEDSDSEKYSLNKGNSSKHEHSSKKPDPYFKEGNDGQSFLSELEQRIPQNPTKTPDREDPVPVLEPENLPSPDESQNDSMQPLTQSSHSSPPSLTQGHKPTRRHHNRKHRRPKSYTSKSSWEESSNASASKRPAYAFVNHTYQDAVLQKLLHENSEDKLKHWIPKSASAYEQVVNSGLSNFDDSTSSGSEDSHDDIWVLQKEKKKFKKETSV